MRGKSTRQSHSAPIYYVDICVNSNFTVDDALVDAQRIEAERRASGFDQVALESAARQGYSNGAFEDSEDEGGVVVEEFFPETGSPDVVSGETRSVGASEPSSTGKSTLLEKLENKAVGMAEIAE